MTTHPGAPASARDLVCGAFLLVYSAVCTVDPGLQDQRPLARSRMCATDLVVCGAIAAFSGGWSSPFLLCVGGSLMVWGLVGGVRALGWGLLIVGVGIGTTEVFASASGWVGYPLTRSLELAVMGGVGACVRHAMLGVVGQRGELDRLRSAVEVHELLLDVYARAIDQPGALTVQGSVAAVVQHVERLFAPDVVVVLLRDPTSTILYRPWEVTARKGAELPSALAHEELPAVLRRVAEDDAVGYASSLRPGTGLGATSRTGMYLPLRAGAATTGLIGVEREGAQAFTECDVEALYTAIRHIGQAIENARLLGRLRVLGADDERERFARELHDRVGQSLAAIAVTADGAALSSASGDDQRAAFGAIAAATRSVIQEVRDELTDLRTEPDEQLPLVDLFADLTQRVGRRSGLQVTFVSDVPRLPQAVEREVWRVACEAVGNAERHADARQVVLGWMLAAGAPRLTVSDDGNGLTGRHPLRRDAYGLRGMRERAEMIGGRLEIAAVPGQGTTVTLTLPALGVPGEARQSGVAGRGREHRLREVMA